MMSKENEKGDEKDSAKGIAYFWRSTNLEPRIRSATLLQGVSKVSLGNHHTLLLTFNSQLYSVGDNSLGQLGLGDLLPRKEPTEITYFSDKRVREIACGSQHSGVVCANGDVYFWGDSSSGQCGIGNEKFTSHPTKVQFKPDTDPNKTRLSSTFDKGTESSVPVIKQLACGDSHTLALSSDGEVWSWGTGCQVGHGVENEKVSTPRRIDFFVGKNVIAVVCGAFHSLALVRQDAGSPTFTLHGNEYATSASAYKEQTHTFGKKQRKMSKGSLKKSKKSLGEAQQAKLQLSQHPKSDNRSVTPSKGQPTVSRTYLSYVHVPNDANNESSKNSDNFEEMQSGPKTECDQCTDSVVVPHTEGSPYEVSQSGLGSDAAHNDLSLAVCATHYALTEQNPVDNRSVQTRIPQSKSPLDSPEQVFVNTESIEDYALYETVSPGLYSSPGNNRCVTYFVSTDSDSEDASTTASSNKKHKERSISDYKGNSFFYSNLGSRLIRSDVNLSKLTSAVVGSVTGIFMSPVPAQLHAQDTSKTVTAKSPCQKCGLLGLCLCDNESVLNSTAFKLAGANTEVWSWGRGGCGQLGLGDTDDRSVPCCVRELNDVGVMKVAAGTFHSLAQTIYSQVFSWGDNSCGQLGHKKSMALQPRKVKCFSEVLIWDIAAGSHYSLFVGDMALNKPDVYVCGRQPSAMPSVAATMSSIRESRSLPSLVPEDSATVPTAGENKEKLILSKSFDDTKERSLQHSRVEIVRLTMFREVSLVRCVLASSERCACLAASNKSGHFQILSELASEERLFYYQLSLIWQAVLVPVLQSEVWFCLALQEAGEVLSPIIKYFYGLMKCISSSLETVTRIVQSGKHFQDLFQLCWSDEFLQTFDRYSEHFNNGVAFGVFAGFSNISSDISNQCRAVLGDILDSTAQDFVSDDNAFQYMMQVPLLKMHHHRDILKKLQSTLTEKDTVARLQEFAELWDQIIRRFESRLVDAERTQKFWRESTHKITETFRDCRRRLLRRSSIHSLFPSKGSRFSSHQFLLFDDFFVHLQSQKHFQAHSLATLWAEAMDDIEGVLNGIKILTPEDILLVCAPSPADKAEWLKAINEAVAKVISKTTAYRLGSEAVNANTGSLVAGAAREATYTFLSDSRYCGATYHGMWLHAKPHGHGEMHWPDGRHFTGEFKYGLQHGDGVMIFPPNTTAYPGEKYEGQWEDGQMTGYGKMRYSNGGVYEGHWSNDQRCGHGCMKCGGISSSGATVYIGEWNSDKKSGYGVMDDILRGEKYMGMWEADCRSGPGLLVTLDGIFNQGTFVQNRLAGSGVLLCDDNTRYEGEFDGDCQLAGKGILTMPNGDFIDGTFTGQWGDAIRVNGTFYKLEATGAKPSPASSTTTPGSKYSIPPEKKWIALFLECRRALGCDGDRDADRDTVWNSISMAMMSERSSKQEIMQELYNINSEYEVQRDLKILQAYLSKAFDMRHHPLGKLVNGLIDVFRASYVGMGTHRRLLKHAVAETKSFVTRVYNLLRLVFPVLPNEEYVLVTSDAMFGVSNHSTEESTTSSMLLHPLLFPRLYPPLFTLYALDNERADSAYWERIQQLNKRSDWALMTYVGMKRHFWLTKEQEVGIPYSDEIKLESRESKHYHSAIDSLQQISTKFSPMEKLKILKTTFEKINEEVGSFWQGEKRLVSLDDLFPVFQFVVIRARIPHLGSEIHFIDDMVDSHVHVGEQGHMFTTLKACFFQIQNEKG